MFFSRLATDYLTSFVRAGWQWCFPSGWVDSQVTLSSFGATCLVS